MTRFHRVLVAAALAVTAACQAGPPPAGDLLLVNGRVYTLAWGEPARDGTPAADAPHDRDGWHPDAEAVFIRDGVIAFVGSSADARRFAGTTGTGARVVDVQGATVLPGLIDSHTHVENLGSDLSQVSLVGIETEAEAVARVAARAREVPPGRWILGHGWDEGAWANRYPTMERLSAAVPDHPVLLSGLHGFAVWGNALALERAGITRETEAPSGGEILRDAEGNPTGVLANRATVLLTAAAGGTTVAQRAEHIAAGLEIMAASGFVAVHEAGVGRDSLAAFERLDDAGRLHQRVYAMLSARDEDLCREWLQRGPWSGDNLVVRAVKAYYDGALGSRGAKLLEYYYDMPGHLGVAGDEYGFDQELVADMMRAGFQVAVHAIGDAGNRESLDFIDAVAREEASVLEGRHRIEHAQVVDPDDFERFRALGLIASMEPPHAMEDKAWAADRLGPVRLQGAYAWRSLRQAGAGLTFNSDLPGSDHDIFYGLHSAITRQDKQLQPAGGWFPGQRMTAEEAVRGYTTWAARAEFAEAETGVLAPGYRGDVTVIDVDPFVLGGSDPHRILAGSVVLTVVRGNVLFEAGAPQD